MTIITSRTSTGHEFRRGSRDVSELCCDIVHPAESNDVGIFDGASSGRLRLLLELEQAGGSHTAPWLLSFANTKRNPVRLDAAESSRPQLPHVANARDH